MFNGTSREATEKRKGTSNLYSFWTGKNHHDRIRHWITWKNMTHIQACPQAPVRLYLILYIYIYHILIDANMQYRLIH